MVDLVADVHYGMFVKTMLHCLSIWKTVSPFLAVELLVSIPFLYGRLLYGAICLYLTTVSNLYWHCIRRCGSPAPGDRVGPGAPGSRVGSCTACAGHCPVYAIVLCTAVFSILHYTALKGLSSKRLVNIQSKNCKSSSTILISFSHDQEVLLTCFISSMIFLNY